MPAALKPRYHPFLYLIMALSGMAELGLATYLLRFNRTWATPHYHSVLILFVFNAVWTTLFSTSYVLWIFCGYAQLLASVSSSVIYLFLTSVLWGTAAGITHNASICGRCPCIPLISRISLAVEALGWAEFGLCSLTLLSTCLWVYSSKSVTRAGYSYV